MSILNYEEEELFPLSFADAHTDSHMTNLNISGASASPKIDDYDSFNALVPPPLLAESPNGIELSDTELDDEMSYQQQLIGSPLLYTSERVASSPEQYKKHGFLIKETEKISTPSISTARDLGAGELIDASDEFADAAQQNYRLWLRSF